MVVSAAVVDLKLVVYHILSDFSLLKTNDNLLYIILVIIFFTGLVELTLFLFVPFFFSGGENIAGSSRGME